MILVSVLRTHCLALDSEDFFFPIVFYKAYSLSLIFKIMIHCVFVQDITSFIFFNLWMSICLAPFVEKAIFNPLNHFCSFVNHHLNSYLLDMILSQYISFCVLYCVLLICVAICQHHILLVIVTILWA